MQLTFSAGGCLFAALARSKLLKITRLSNHGAEIIRPQLTWLQSLYHLMKLGGAKYELPKAFFRFIS